MSFQRGLDPKDALGIGTSKLTKDWLEKYTNLGKDYPIERIEVDGYPIFYVDVDGNVELKGYHINDVGKIPSYIKFRKVSGRFILTNNN